jgi:molybdopterin-guanine dinucleotide biosynthesis protein A
LIDAVPVRTKDTARFTNINSPDDLAKLDGHSR